jgi:ABC-2 type transport system permease protein/sodium transport system permease protein
MRGIDLQAVEGVQATLTAWRQESVWLILFAFALVPAVFEELTFRGFLFAAIARKGTAAQAIVVTSVAFGLFHVLGAVLTVERLLPSTALGFVLGWVAYRSQSVIPGMILHAVHNGLLLSVAYYSEELQQRGIGVEEGAHLPWSWLISGILVASAGFLGLWWGTRTPRPVNAIVN